MSRPKDPTIWRDVHGIVLVDKPQGLSSNQALQKVRRLFRAAKGGHTGSLDPLATGLLPVCLGEATKIAGHLLGASKAYVADVRLGATTATADAEGEILETRPVPPLDAAAIERALAPLRGRIRQVPPIYSALKQDGVPLYRLAREGVPVQVEAREVEVFRLDLVSHDGADLRLAVECGSGTYVRSLARDLGEALGCGAHLTALRRTASGDWTLAHAIPLADCERDVAAMHARVVPMSGLLSSWPAVTVNVDGERRIRHGQMLRPADLISPATDTSAGMDAAAGAEPECEGIRVLTAAGDLIAIAQPRADGLLHPGLVLV